MFSDKEKKSKIFVAELADDDLSLWIFVHWIQAQTVFRIEMILFDDRKKDCQQNDDGAGLKGNE